MINYVSRLFHIKLI